MTEIGDNSTIASEILIKGGLVAIPTETVYGLAANAFNENAVLSIFKAKNRPFFDPLILHTDSIEKIKKWVIDFPIELENLFTHFAPGPITVLLPKKSFISDLLTSGLERVAFRIPNHPKTLELLKNLDFPLAAPSANPFGYISPTSPKHVNDQLNGLVDYILDGGTCSVGIESTIVGLENNELVIYRLGGLSVDDIKSYYKGIVRINEKAEASPLAPGMLKSHYSPLKKLFLLNDMDLNSFADLNNALFLRFTSYLPTIDKNRQIILSLDGSLEAAAKNLFSSLRILDSRSDYSIIISQFVPNEGLGLAINDRLMKAASK